MSCQAPISPAFKAAISSGVCPACGGEMMNDATKTLLSELREALEEMPNDPEGLAGWLLSHYALTKIGTGEPVQQFYGKPAPGARPGLQAPPGPNMSYEEQLRQQPRIAPNRLQRFQEATGMKQKDKEAYATLVRQIHDGTDLSPEDTANLHRGLDPAMDAEFIEEIEDPIYTQQVLANMTEGVGGPMSAQDRAALSTAFEPELSNAINPGYDPNLSPALNEDRMERLRKSQIIANGGKAGMVSRKG